MSELRELLDKPIDYKSWSVRYESGLGWIFTQPDYDGAPDADCICGIATSLKDAFDCVDDFIELYPERFEKNPSDEGSVDLT